MVLQSLQLLLKAIADLVLIFITSFDCFQLAANANQLAAQIVELNFKLMICLAQLLRPAAFRLLLPRKLPLGLQQEAVALVGTFAVLL